jgi:hypothetical protein
VTNSGPFQNLESYVYWPGTEYAHSPIRAWTFHTDGGYQFSAYSKGNQFLARAVRPGQVAPVPIPPAAWLFGSALAGLLGLRRRAAPSDLG